MLCFIIEILVAYDYWYTFFCSFHALVLIVFAIKGLIPTILLNTTALLTATENLFIKSSKKKLNVLPYEPTHTILYTGFMVRFVDLKKKN